MSYRAQWVPVAPHIKPGECGSAQIEHFTVSTSDSAFSALRPGSYVPPGSYVRLFSNGDLVMSDTCMERNTNWYFLHAVNTRAGRGDLDVFVAGLGLGMILLPILPLKPVKSVTVIEQNPDVVSLVEPPLREYMKQTESEAKLEIITADALEWRPPKGRMWDVIYFDIWPFICLDNLEQITKLKRRFARRKRDGGFMAA